MDLVTKRRFVTRKTKLRFANPRRSDLIDPGEGSKPLPREAELHC
ncbi:hypothetical protein [Thiobaca trueperi]|uniref:Uncharacterized protein n=1 Tax=Thiobaca trueperi TaxID=127458 RepID=A0A4R3MZA0_9GAMM|nr:hypothetical protein [Thiobaca trueperi]TCT22028.1 hypothetical protein EDC35_103126 [Thiobaca trueperi]